MRNQPGCTWTQCGEGQAQLVRKGTTCFERSMALNGSNCYGIIVHCLQEYESRSEVKKDEISVICLMIILFIVQIFFAYSRYAFLLTSFKLSFAPFPVKIVKTRHSRLNCALRDDEAVYWVSIGHFEAVAVGNWWYWVSRGHLCLYILNKVEIWSGVTDALQTDSQILKDSAT